MPVLTLKETIYIEAYGTWDKSIMFTIKMLSYNQRCTLRRKVPQCCDFACDSQHCAKFPQLVENARSPQRVRNMGSAKLSHNNAICSQSHMKLQTSDYYCTRSLVVTYYTMHAAELEHLELQISLQNQVACVKVFHTSSQSRVV